MPRMRPIVSSRRSAVTGSAVDGQHDVPGAHAGQCRRRALDRRHHDDATVGRRDFDADAGVAAGRRSAHLVVLGGVEKGGMRVEVGDDALDRGLVEGAVGDRFDVLPADPADHLVEQLVRGPGLGRPHRGLGGIGRGARAASPGPGQGRNRRRCRPWRPAAGAYGGSRWNQAVCDWARRAHVSGNERLQHLLQRQRAGRSRIPGRTRPRARGWRARSPRFRRIRRPSAASSRAPAARSR